MTYRNTYKPPSTSIDGAAALRVPADEYDFNFVFPVSVLRSDRVELRPFVVCPYCCLRGLSGCRHINIC
jgi:hypothetical protein